MSSSARTSTPPDRRKTVAVVGYSANPDRPSHRVAAYLKARGYRVVAVNPGLDEALGGKAYPRVRDIPGGVDIVDVFRKPEAAPEIVEDALAAKAKVVWMQEGIVHNAAAGKARAAGLKVVMNKCMMKEHRGL